MSRLRHVVLWVGVLFVLPVTSFALGVLWPLDHQVTINGSHFDRSHPSALVGETPIEEEGEDLSGGLRLSFTGRAEYKLRLFRGRFVFEPSLAAAYRTIDAMRPAAFERKERPNFLLEPRLRLGVRF